MLTHIHIRSLATIDELQLDLHSNSTMITGETGAGKSIFIEAIELALGGRGRAEMVRPGQERADISLCFDIATLPHVIERLKNHDLYQENNECIIRRVITQDGRSRIYINGLPTTLLLVREISELLFHLHGQNDQHVLLNAENQREILDQYATHSVLVNQVKQLAQQWKLVDEQIKNLREKYLTQEERRHYLQFQLNELTALQLQANEWEKLEIEHRQLSRHDEVLRHIQQLHQLLADDENNNILLHLHEARKLLEPIQTVDAQIMQWAHTIQSCTIQLSELDNELRHYLENSELDPERLQVVEQRIRQLFDLARKHKVTPTELFTRQAQLQQELQSLDASDATITRLEEKQKQLTEHYQAAAAQLSASRARAAKKMAQEVTHTIQSLSLPHGVFHIELEEIVAAICSHGQEKVVFLIKTNPGQDLQPLAKIISGGELSRLSLAVHLTLTQQQIPILIFDEVDTGVGGATAEKIGKLLRKLGKTCQVFCVTHQAQIAACGHHHLLVEKRITKNIAYTTLRLLNHEEKTREIARMLGGEKISETLLQHAKEVLQSV